MRKVLEEQGRVYSLFYMMDQTMSHKGWAFVTYETIEDARTAIQKMDGKILFAVSSLAFCLCSFGREYVHTKERIESSS